MKVFIYAGKKTKSFQQLLGEIENVFPRNDISIFSTVNDLYRQLNKNTITENYKAITVLFINDRQELQDMLDIHNQLIETRIILILPDKEMETIRAGHKLLPRYLDFIDSNFTEVREVLRKMYQTNSTKSGQ